MTLTEVTAEKWEHENITKSTPNGARNISQMISQQFIQIR